MNRNGTVTRNRMILVEALAFFSTLAAYGLTYVLYASMAAGVAIAWSTAVLILIFYLDRKRSSVLGLENQYSELRSFINLQPMLNPAFLPHSYWAMEPTDLQNLLATIQYNQYRTVVECGAGMSTLLIGKLLKQLGGGHIYSLDEDENWFEVMRMAVAVNDLTEYVTVIHAPLVPNAESGELWYASEQARQILESVEHIDVLVVDGPKSVSALSRAPALPSFADALDSNSLIVLDDSRRDNERAVIEHWRERFNIEIEQLSGSLTGQTYIRIRQNH